MCVGLGRWGKETRGARRLVSRPADLTIRANRQVRAQGWQVSAQIRALLVERNYQNHFKVGMPVENVRSGCGVDQRYGPRSVIVPVHRNGAILPTATPQCSAWSGRLVRIKAGTALKLAWQRSCGSIEQCEWTVGQNHHELQSIVRPSFQGPNEVCIVAHLVNKIIAGGHCGFRCLAR